MGISIGTRWFEPKDYDSLDDLTAAEMSFQFANCWFLNPLLGDEGNYPSVMRIEINVKSVLQGYRESRLPIFTQEEINLIRGSVDFIGINFFTSYNVQSYNLNENSSSSTNYSNFKSANIEQDMFANWLPYDDAHGVYEIKVKYFLLIFLFY